MTLFADSHRSFARLVAAVESQVDTGRRLPGWPFKVAAGFAVIYEYDRLLGGDFGDVLAELAAEYGDEAVTVAGFEPLPSYYRDSYGFFPGFRVSGNGVRDGYGDGLYYEPGGDPTGAMGFTLNVIAVAGSSGSWSVWGQRDWEIGLLLTRDPGGAWLNAGVPWFGHDVDLDSIRAPSDWGMPLSAVEVTAFRSNLHERGSGP